MELPGKQWKQVGQQEGNEKETPQIIRRHNRSIMKADRKWEISRLER